MPCLFGIIGLLLSLTNTGCSRTQSSPSAHLWFPHAPDPLACPGVAGGSDGRHQDGSWQRDDAADRPTWIVLSADPLKHTANQWASYRRRQGYQTLVFTVSDVLAGRQQTWEEFLPAFKHLLVEAIGTKHPKHRTYLMLLGDSNDVGLDPIVHPSLVPTTNWNDEYLSDLPYSDLDDDGLPDLALGRVPVENPDQAHTVLDKVIQYETNPVVGPWRQRVLVFASAAEFGPVADAVIEKIGQDMLASIGYVWAVRFIHASKFSPFGLPPSLYENTLIDSFNSGTLLAIYTGHGYLSSLEDVRWGPEDAAPILDADGIDRIHCGRRCPVLVLAACHTGDFGHGDSLAELLLRQASGPPAVVAATDVSHPFPNAMLALGLARAMLTDRVPILGDAYKQVLQNLGHPNTPIEHRIDVLTSLLWNHKERSAILNENRRMYVLLADPALRLPLGPSPIRMTIRSQTNHTLSVCGATDEQGSKQVHLVLETKRGQLVHSPMPLPQDRSQRDRVAEDNWQQANDRTLWRKTVPLHGRRFTVTVPLPKVPHFSTYILRAATFDAEGTAAGTVSIQVPVTRQPAAAAKTP
ncbi:MAG: hypothetical protein J7M25_18240 [Deltaproteobacteria bacterium]|nr:hypothetical protein [Deltaproteobacteria bacterium]